MKLTRKRVAWAAFTGIGLLVVALFALPLFFPWSELNCSNQEVDTNTGRFRFTEYRLFCRVSERIEESSISKALSGKSVTDTKPNWHKVNTFSPGTRHSPHYIYHSAAHQIRMLEHIWNEVESSGFAELEDFKSASARHVLELWRYGGSDSLAGDYISRLGELVVYEADAIPRLEAVIQLKMPVFESEGDRITTTVFFPDGQPLERVQGYKSASGEFISNGIWEQWSSKGTLLVYGHFVDGEHHGPRYEWDRDGNLSSIKAYTKGTLSDYASENLAGHPEYKAAQQVGGGQPATRPESK